MRPNWKWILALLWTAAPCAALGASSAAFPALNVGWGARAQAMGGSFTAVPGDLASLQYNPAGLALLSAPEFSLTHNSYLESGFIDTGGAALPLGPSGTLAFGALYLNYGALDLRDGSGNLTGQFTPFDLGLRGAYGFSLGKDAYLGLGSQWVRQDINGQVRNGLLWDGGILAPLFPGFHAGAALRNLGVDSGGGSLPALFALGASYRVEMDGEGAHALLFSLEGDLAFEGPSRASLGFEYAFQHRYFLRGGYSKVMEEDPSDELKGLDLGAGVRLSQFQLDYSFSFLGDLGNAHRISLSLFLPGGEGRGEGGKPKEREGALSFQPPVNQPSNPVLLKFKVTNGSDGTAQELFDRAEEKMREGQKEEALDLYLKAASKDPDFQMAWMALGKLYFDKSLEAYRKVLEKDPDNGKLREWLGHFK